jgi:formate/nitrite transporter FocA (FNT family)
VTAREPQEMAQVAAETGAKKTHRTWDRMLVSAFLAGAYIAFGAVPGIGAEDWLWNWLLAGAGNLVGAVVFVATSYWYLFLRDLPDVVTPAAEPPERA